MNKTDEQEQRAIGIEERVSKEKKIQRKSQGAFGAKGAWRTWLGYSTAQIWAGDGVMVGISKQGVSERGLQGLQKRDGRRDKDGQQNELRTRKVGGRGWMDEEKKKKIEEKNRKERKWRVREKNRRERERDRREKEGSEREKQEEEKPQERSQRFHTCE